MKGFRKAQDVKLEGDICDIRKEQGEILKAST